MVREPSVTKPTPRHSGIFPTAASSAASSRSSTADAIAYYAATEDDVLVAALLADDARAWRAFQQRFDRLLLRCITKVTRRFAMVAQDDVHEIYAQLFVALLSSDKHKLRAFNPARGSRLASYLGMLAVHAAYDHLRSVRREPVLAPLGETDDFASDAPDPFELTERKQQAAIAESLLADLTERDRDFAVLYFGEGMDPAAIAEAMNISVKTVYSKKHKIQSRLFASIGGSAGYDAPSESDDAPAACAA